MRKIQRHNSINIKEIKTVNKVLKKGLLSGFYGSPGNFFLGGENVRKFENKISKFYKVKFAVTFNSWTSGLIAALGAINIEPGDEVICTPWTMTATATAILHWNAIPVFVDIEPDFFGMNLKILEKKITKKTKAIMAVDIFGQSENINPIIKLAKKYKLKVISDSAHAPYAKINKKFVGTLSDVGGFSFNHHKHINTGEGGVAITNDPKIARKLRLIRNHGEAVVSKKINKNELSNIIGHNFRLGEIEAAIGIEQMKKLKRIVYSKIKLANILSKELTNLPGLQVPKVRKNCTHNYYIYPLVISKNCKIKRNQLIKKLKDKNIPGIIEGYQNLHLQPIYQNKIAYGRKHFPWSMFKSKVNYKKGICPVAEQLHAKKFWGILICSYDFSERDIKEISKIIKKTWYSLLK